MNEYFIPGLLIGMLAALMMNIGKGVQKQYVHVFLNGRQVFRKEHRRNLGLWILGFCLTAGAAVPYSLALKLSQSPSAIAAMTGIGLTGLGLYAVKVIGERFGVMDLVGITLVIIGTSLLGYSGAEKEIAARHFLDWQLLFALSVIVVSAATVCCLSRLLPRMHGVAFGGAAGIGIGLAIFLGDIALVRAGGSFSGQLSNPFPYVALLFAASATVLTQFGFLKSRAIEVVSAVNSAAILTPLLLEVIVYGVHPDAMGVAFILCIVTGVIFLSRGAPARVSARGG